MLKDTDRQLKYTSNKTNRSKISPFIKLLHLKKWINLFLGNTAYIYIYALKTQNILVQSLLGPHIEDMMGL